MDGELKSKWVSALRSGEFQQGKEHLLKEGAFCCLGVLCAVAGADMSKQKRKVFNEDGEEAYTEPTAWFDDRHYSEDEELSQRLQDYFGIGTMVESTLIKMNDGGDFDFGMIADWIDAHDLKTGNEAKVEPR